jgi:hypothetical protein
MRAISLWQPWATAIALGAKTIETRHWYTEYRGPLVIHAAKRCVKSELKDLFEEREWRGVFHMCEWPDVLKILPLGALVAVAQLVDCRPTETFTAAVLDAQRESGDAWWTERDMGDFYPGRFGWVLKNIQPIVPPVPYKGSQGFFEVPERVLGLEART